MFSEQNNQHNSQRRQNSPLGGSQWTYQELVKKHAASKAQEEELDQAETKGVNKKTFGDILLMEDIPNNYLGGIKPCK